MIRKGQQRTRKGNPAIAPGRALQLPSVSTPSATDSGWASIANVSGVPYWTTSSGATELESATWSTVLDLDLTAEANQTLSSDTTYTIGSKTWTKVNTSNDSAPGTVLANGTGLQITTTSGAGLNWNNGTRSLPGVYIPMTSLLSTFESSMGVRVWFYEPTDVEAADNDISGAWLYTGSSTDFSWSRLWSGGATNVSTSVIKNNGASAGTAAALALGAGNRVMCMTVPNLLEHKATYAYGAYSAGWPAVSTLTTFESYDAGTSASRRTDGTQALTASNWRVGMFAGRINGSGTSPTFTFARFRVDVLRRL